MFGLEILDVVIGLMFVYLLLSLLATALNEYLAAVLNLRGRELARGLGRLLDDIDEKGAVKTALRGVGPEAPAANATLTEQFYNHRLIRPLATRRGWLSSRWRKEPRLPSYIPARTFAMALLDVLGYKATTADAPAPADTQKAALVEIMDILKRESPLDVVELKGLLAGTSVPEALAPRVLEALTGTQNRLRNLHDSVEVWFNNAMDRVSGAYKRTAQGWLFLLGLVIASCSNADTIDMWRRLASNDQLREAMVQRAIGRLPALEPRVQASLPAAAGTDSPAPPDTTATDTTTTDNTATDTTTTDTTAAATDTTAADDSAADDSARTEPPVDSKREAYLAARNELDSMELKLGWTQEQLREAGLLRLGSDAPDWFPFDRFGFWVKLLGLLLTAVAISLGAPFWFDLLNKVISIRTAGRSPEEKPKSPQGGPKRPAEHTPK